ncbi:hypothetical protein NVIRPANT_01018 [Pantoea sp. Nvir]|nr:hypothetical protein NVIRPANT_01018 [Pantoea sp. Nvir]
MWVSAIPDMVFLDYTNFVTNKYILSLQIHYHGYIFKVIKELPYFQGRPYNILFQKRYVIE